MGERDQIEIERGWCKAHDSLSGNHWQVRLGQSSA